MKLGEVGRGEVEPGARVGTWPIEKSSAFRPALAKGILDFRADFITAGTNRRSERGDEAPGTRAESAAHRGDSCFGDPIERPSPARVDCRNGAPVGIGHEDRQAVRHPDGEQDLRFVGHQNIALGPGSCLRRQSGRRVRGGVRRNVGHASAGARGAISTRGMNLLEVGEREAVHSEGLEEPAAVRFDRLA